MNYYENAMSGYWSSRLDQIYYLKVNYDVRMYQEYLNFKNGLVSNDNDIVNITKVAIILKENKWD